MDENVYQISFYMIANNYFTCKDSYFTLPHKITPKIKIHKRLIVLAYKQFP